MVGQEENFVMLSEFLERGDRRILVITVASNGQLTPTNTFPTSSKNKSVYYIKRQPEAIKKDNIKTLLMFGDVSHIPLEQLSYLVESVSTDTHCITLLPLPPSLLSLPLLPPSFLSPSLLPSLLPGAPPTHHQ